MSIESQRLLIDPSRYPGLPERLPEQVEMRLWLYQKDGPRLSWTLYRQGDEAFIRRVVASPTGELAADEAPISKVTVVEIRKWLGKTDVPPFPDRWFAMKGEEQRGLVLCNPFVKSRYSWVGPSPKGWKPLALWHERTVFSLEQRLPDSAIPFEVRIDHTIHD